LAVSEGLLPEEVLSDGKQLFGDLSEWIRESDLALLNLECPLTSRGKPLTKTGPNLKGSSSVLQAVKQTGFSLVGLANNHILDYGADGVQDTIANLDYHQIGYFGADESLAKARKFHIRTVNGVRIAFCGMAEHEFSIAEKDSAGANPLDIISFQRELEEQQGAYDVLIVLLHGGAEHYPYPTPDLQKTCRFLVECGASAVVCQHSHCAGCHEYYRGKPIVYGQGNFFFPKTQSMTEPWSQGLLLKLCFNMDSNSNKVKMELFPTLQTVSTVREMPLEMKTRFLKDYNIRSNNVIDENFVRDRWTEWCMVKMDQYIPLLLGYGRIRRRIYRLLRKKCLERNQRRFLVMKNIVSCETHRETIQMILKSLSATNNKNL